MIFCPYSGKIAKACIVRRKTKWTRTRAMLTLAAFVDRARKVASPVVVIDDKGQRRKSVLDMMNEFDRLVEAVL